MRQARELANSDECANRQGREIFERRESSVRSYCRSFPAVFAKAHNARLTDVAGRSYLDFLSGAGALNYGHNNEVLVAAMRRHLDEGLIIQGLDLYTQPKQRFIELFESLILLPRDLGEYRIQFTGPTGANAVEAAAKLARLVTGRDTIAAFTRAYHGVSLGALGMTGNRRLRAAGGLPSLPVQRLPYDGYLGDTNTIEFIAKLYADPSSGFDAPAAFIVETVQGEGGLNVASVEWLQQLAQLARSLDALLIVDDIQAGCGRTGTFFSFQPAKIKPDIVCLSKSISGSGLPMSLLLIKGTIDRWQPGDHTGTFRGNNLAFTTASAALETFWSDDRLAQSVRRKGAVVRKALDDIGAGTVVGRGLMAGLKLSDGAVAEAVSRRCFDLGLIVETCGPRGEVLKLLPPLTVTDHEVEQGLAIVQKAVREVVIRH